MLSVRPHFLFCGRVKRCLQWTLYDIRKKKHLYLIKSVSQVQCRNRAAGLAAERWWCSNRLVKLLYLVSFAAETENHIHDRSLTSDKKIWKDKLLGLFSQILSWSIIHHYPNSMLNDLAHLPTRSAAEGAWHRARRGKKEALKHERRIVLCYNSVKSEHKDMIHIFLYSVCLLLPEDIIISDVHCEQTSINLLRNNSKNRSC